MTDWVLTNAKLDEFFMSFKPSQFLSVTFT